MGVEQSVTFASGVPDWTAVKAVLQRVNYGMQMRMIDGQLAFPDEEPAADWRELRLGTAGGMVTVRREPGRAIFVIWGNADAALLRGRNALIWAFAEAGQGLVEGSQSAADFFQTADLPTELQKG